MMMKGNNEILTDEQKLSLMIVRSVDMIDYVYSKHGSQARLELKGLRNGLLVLINDKNLTDEDKRVLAKLPSLYKIDLNVLSTFDRK